MRSSALPSCVVRGLSERYKPMFVRSAVMSV